MSSENINYIYKNAKTNGTNYAGVIILGIIILSIYGYLYTKVQQKMIGIDLNQQRCNPRYIFFSGFLNPLYKDPMIMTDRNFKRCVATYIYKDPTLTKEIKRNEQFIRKHDYEIKENLVNGKKRVDEIKKKWEDINENNKRNIQVASLDAGNIIQTQRNIHTTFSDKTIQLFELFQSLIVYIQGNLVYLITNHQKEMSIEETHKEYMKKYERIYEKYKDAFKQLNEEKWTQSMNVARDAIKEYNDLSKELDKFMEIHESKIKDITESCYQLKYNLDDNTCKTIFPNLNEGIIDHYPMIKKMIE